MSLKAAVQETLEKQKGVLFARPAIVHRIQYSGRDIIAKNKRFDADHTDERGYVPVEWWIMSLTQAENGIMKDGEGISSVLLRTNGEEKSIAFPDIVKECEVEVLGSFAKNWPLTKILDIGGEEISTSLGTTEVPPIPCHVHSGDVVDGKAVPSEGKLEAYFFPPLNVPPYNADVGRVITRIGLRPDVKKEDVIACLNQFGKDDSMYGLCTVYEVSAYDGWTVLPGTLHAPGPWVTFEIQRPQDDFNLASWQLGQRIEDEEEHSDKKTNLQLRGLDHEEHFVEEVVEWEHNVDPDFEKKWRRKSQVLEEGTWGRRLQIFFDDFYGEGFEVQPGEEFSRAADNRPFAGIVWSGEGELNGNALNVSDESAKEFLVTPNTQVVVKNTGSTPLLIYTVFPIDEGKA